MHKADDPILPGDTSAPRRRSVLRDTISGALLGGAFGMLLLGVGLVRIVGALLLGSHIAPLGSADARIIAYYVGSLVVAGAGLGAAKPFLRTRVGTYAGFALAGAFVGIAITLAIAQGDRDPISPTGVIVVGTVVGATMGCALAYGQLRGPG